MRRRSIADPSVSVSRIAGTWEQVRLSLDPFFPPLRDRWALVLTGGRATHTSNPLIRLIRSTQVTRRQALNLLKRELINLDQVTRWHALTMQRPR